MSNKMMNLKCEFDGHEFTIESRRGRPPKFCENHQPTLADSGPEFRTVHCENGNHDWDAPRRRGAAPKNCPTHAPISPKKSVSVKTNVIREDSAGDSALLEMGELLAKEAQLEKNQRIHHINNDPNNNELSNLEIQRELHCENGDHNYWDKIRRGKPPKNCNLHKPSPELTQKISDEKKSEKEKEKLSIQIDDAKMRIETAVIIDNQAYTQMNNSNEEFNNWLRANSRLMNELSSLRAKEIKLERIGL